MLAPCLLNLAIDTLTRNNIYFNTQHFYIPIVHPGRYLKAFYGGPLMKPPMCLQYSIWALASYLNDKYASFSDIFYQRARQYVEADELKVRIPFKSNHEMWSGNDSSTNYPNRA